MTVAQEFTATAAPAFAREEGIARLFYAIRKDDTAQIKALAAQGVPLDAEDGDNMLPLALAANIGALASVKTLLALGAKPDATDIWGRMAGHFSAQREYAEISALLPRPPPNFVPAALQHARFDVDEKGTVAAGVTIGSGGLESISLPKSKLLMDAAKRGFAETLAIFTVQKIETNIEDDEGHSLLYHAAASGSAKAADVLLAAGFDPNRQEEAKVTPLRAAMEGGFADVVSALLAGGADPYARSKSKDGTQEMADIEYATLHGTPAIKEAVTAAAVRFQVNLAAARGDIVSARIFLEQGVPPDTYDFNGYTALLHATLGKHADIVKLLLAYKADPNRPWKYGPDVPLHSAVRQGDKESTAALVEAGAKTGIGDNKGLDALALAGERDNAEVYRIVSRQRGREIEEAIGSAAAADVSAPAKASFKRKALAP